LDFINVKDDYQLKIEERKEFYFKPEPKFEYIKWYIGKVQELDILAKKQQ